jgi:hypothetical protein
MLRCFFLWSALLLSACGETPPASPSASSVAADPAGLDAIARAYVALILELGEHEPGYVDAYYGPPEWSEAARANLRDTAALAAAAAALVERLAAIAPNTLDGANRQRRAYLLAHVEAAAARLRMLDGESFTFAGEAAVLFGITPELPPLRDFDPVLARIAELIPGAAPLAERVAEFRTAYDIPAARVDAVMRAALAQCSERTRGHMALPANERFTLEYVTDKPWSGYNWYQGNANSLIQINTDLPISISRAVDLGCHEGYPGHHVYNVLLEQTFVRERGWVEMSIFPLYSPMAFIAEGSANYGIDLAFPGPERLAFEKQVLYPLAGLDPATAAALDELLALIRELGRAEYTIASEYLAGRLDSAAAIGLLQTYGLSTQERAAQRLSFIDTYRSYIINYGLGRDTVQAWVERQGPDHWATTLRLLSSQLLPVDMLQ